MDEEERRTFRVIYKGPIANFASVNLDTSQSIHIKQSIYPVSHPLNHGVLHIGIMVFSLAFAIRDNAKLSVCFGMLKLSCLGYKLRSKASDCIQRTGSKRWKKEDIYTGMVGGRALNCTNQIKQH